MNAIAVIPARFHSTRFPGKPLAKIGRLPMVIRVFEAARLARLVSEVYIATDSEEIAEVGRSYGAKVIITSSSCRNGTARVEAAIRGIRGDIILNVQGDEPLIRPETIDRLIEAIEPGGAEIATVATSRADVRSYRDSNCVKVVVDQNNDAMYFSRAPIPFNGRTSFLLHVGVYAFRRAAFDSIAIGKRTALEERENLEQLRWMEKGMKIRVVRADYPLVAVDTPADAARAALFLD